MDISCGFAVFFDEPIGGACGLKVLEVVPAYSEPTPEPTPDQTLPQLSTIECDLTNIAERTVTAAVTVSP